MKWKWNYWWEGFVMRWILLRDEFGLKRWMNDFVKWSARKFVLNCASSMGHSWLVDQICFSRCTGHYLNTQGVFKNVATSVNLLKFLTDFKKKICHSVYACTYLYIYLISKWILKRLLILECIRHKRSKDLRCYVGIVVKASRTWLLARANRFVSKLLFNCHDH